MVNLPNLFHSQSAVLPYRFSGETPELLLITSRNRKRWVLPKGFVEAGLTPWDSAIKEAFEEAGIEGEVSKKSIGTYLYEKCLGVCSVEVFLMRVITEYETWPEASLRRKEWTSLNTAAQRVSEQGLREIIHRLPDVLDESHSSSRLRHPTE